ncbi:hypothetical protein Tco_1410638 [Tanacetum coccineum]
MVVEDTTPPTPPPSTTNKIIPFSIPNKVPIKLDLEKHNYNSWSSFSLFHLGSLGLKSHVETDTAFTNPKQCQLDDHIKMWILGSLCDSLQEQVVTTPGNAKALWDHLKELFHDIKYARALNLDNELRSIRIGKMTVNEYCTKIKSMSVFATLVEIIRHRETFPAFETVGTMRLLKNSSFNDDSGFTDFEVVRPPTNRSQGKPIHQTTKAQPVAQSPYMVQQVTPQGYFTSPMPQQQQGLLDALVIPNKDGMCNIIASSEEAPSQNDNQTPYIKDTPTSQQGISCPLLPISPINSHETHT